MGIDYIYGRHKELQIKKLLPEIYNQKFRDYGQTQYETFDFISADNNIILELKSRRCNYNKYPTTIVGLNKIDIAKELIEKGKTVKFLFNFLDGLYEWCDLNQYEIAKGGRTDLIGNRGWKDYAHIKIDNLTLIKSYA
tara:strand:- start:200 stop:613 length:414 start_codon:yes stop_codon:yes gene_type:complete